MTLRVLVVQKELDAPYQDDNIINVSLKYPDYTTAYRMAESINKNFKGSAVPIDGGFSLYKRNLILRRFLRVSLESGEMKYGIQIR